jgi:hypothetical protein
MAEVGKALMGETCTSCGHCCKDQACEASIQLLQSAQVPCMALEVDGDRFACGLMKRPHFYFGLAWDQNDCEKLDGVLGPLVAKYLGAGQGCGCPDEV